MKFLFLLPILFAFHSSQAAISRWDGIGNGGWIVVVKGKPGIHQKSRAYSLDYIEAQFQFLTWPKSCQKLFILEQRIACPEAEHYTNLVFEPLYGKDRDGLSISDFVQGAMRRISKLDPDLYRYLVQEDHLNVPLNLALEIESYLEGKNKTNSNLIYFSDSGIGDLRTNLKDFKAKFWLPIKAKILTAAVQDALRFGKPRFVQIYTKHLSDMDSQQLAMLVMHEAIYSYAINVLGHESSDATRRLNAFYFSDLSSKYDQSEYLKFKSAVKYVKMK